MKVPMPGSRSLLNDIPADHKTNADLNMVCIEKSDSNLKLCVSTETDVNLDPSEFNNHSNSQINDKTENERVSKTIRGKKSTISLISKDMKPRCGLPFSNKSGYYNKPVKHTLPKKKLQPSVSHLTNTSAKVVLFERNVEIKDLESKVKYLHSQIQKLENENKTLQNVQSRQERELKMFKEGVADIPSLLRSHKEETKMYETSLSNTRRELRDCQKDLKNKNETLLKKESLIDKLNVSLKHSEKRIRETSCELKELKAEKFRIQDEYKLLSEATTNLKSLNEDQQKKIKIMTHQIKTLEENLLAEKEEKRQLEDDMHVLKKKLEVVELKVPFEEKLVPPITVSCLQIEDNSCGDPQENKEREIYLDSKQFTVETIESIQENGYCLDKLDDALIQPFKNHHKDLSSPKFGECSFKNNKTSNHNLKLLPPLKQSCKKYPPNLFKGEFDVEDEECSSPPSQYEAKYRNDQWHSEVLEKYFQNRLKPSKLSKSKSLQ